MYNTSGPAPVEQSPTAAAPAFEKRYRNTYKRMSTWEVWLNYNAMSALGPKPWPRPERGGRRGHPGSLPKAFPLLGDKYASEWMGITQGGRMYCPGSIQVIDQEGKYGQVQLVLWMYKTEAEFKQAVAQSQVNAPIKWVFHKFEKEE